MIETTCKIECCFADNIYKKYQSNRWGINYCVKPEKEDLETLDNLKEIYTYNQYTSNLEDSDCCNINHIIEKINRL
jgi:hypothetical protein